MSKSGVAILAQNGVYAYFSVAFMPIVLGIFSRNVGLKAPVAASITAFIVHFGVYYFLPVLVESFDLQLGFFTKFLQGEVRNPAIASSSAIVLSSIVGLMVHLLSKKKPADRV